MKIKILEKVVVHLPCVCLYIDSLATQLPDLQPPEEEETENFKQVLP